MMMLKGMPSVASAGMGSPVHVFQQVHLQRKHDVGEGSAPVDDGSICV